ncbi:uL15m family ribosomal protein [Pyrobaculum neutrophilum]|uniref:Large ribosomal subunit protein uL15 n=1 Tax=Pyrobaculum neutrophilum (strain DSM 2338 / JCM 9278 / NBRC 100436 / V24Sta) TaxID=444157 RepID=RL15_PYRNV|nr:uL15 family ribosomal protein [Pyrobaculum neutrophilum]B1Y901.1 RecName: Full=Large ribosomal subunit protein uL15; AltName: Full=50S ribosomal protein L15 [Pyrobaculum neutrophilum V24Sta]ACB40230.1 ribosomal protein L15 [Pyrobaculum neutrophilum V24Sta]
MVRRFKRAVKYRRGSRTHGWGRVGQHRKSGGSGGKGMVGFHKHKWSLVMKYGESGTGWPFYGKHGFKQPQAISIEWRPINVGTLAEVVRGLKREGRVKEEGGRYVVNLVELGFNKLLGGGDVDLPIVVYTPAASRSAVEKIEKAGGEVRIVPAVHR